VRPHRHANDQCCSRGKCKNAFHLFLL
jgi:hypothetical protein